VTRTAYLRVYLPLSSFPEEERRTWSSDGKEPDADAAARRWLLHTDLPDAWPRDGALLREVDGNIFVCPFRTRLRMLAGMLAFRGTVPEEVADIFVPEDQATRAARELANLETEAPKVRSHVMHANWHVPLRWFAAFRDAGRILTEDRNGLRIRYEAPLGEARARLEEAVEILEGSWTDDTVTAAVRELFGWLTEFPPDGLLELDYGSVAGAFSDETLVEDRSAEGVWVCLEALRTGDVVKASRVFGELAERWSEVRAREVVN
jgi:hypothetical protein